MFLKNIVLLHLSKIQAEKTYPKNLAISPSSVADFQFSTSMSRYTGQRFTFVHGN